MDSTTIVKGREYTYTSGIPVGCIGHRYRVLGFPMNVPTYQELVLVRAMTGPDKGLLFTCSRANFAMRYVEVAHEVLS